MRRMYSQNELEKLVKEVFLADVESGEIDFAQLMADGVEAGALEDSDVVAKTLYQKEPLWEADIKSLVRTEFAKSNTFYSKLSLLGNVLWLVISGKFVNGTGTSVNDTILSGTIDIPDWLAEKIYRAEGTTLKDAPTGSGTSRYIASVSCARETNNLANASCVLVSNTAKAISVSIYGMGTRAEDGNYWIDIRIPILIA